MRGCACTSVALRCGECLQGLHYLCLHAVLVRVPVVWLLKASRPDRRPGVLPVPVQRMVETWGTKIESKLNSKEAVRWLTQCSGITAKKAAAIKEAWDATKGGCGFVVFLCGCRVRLLVRLAGTGINAQRLCCRAIPVVGQ